MTRLGYIAERLLRSVVVIGLIMVASFFLVRLAPGDAVDFMIEGGAPDPEYVAELRRQLGLDRPLLEQFLIYAGKLVRLDLGYSLRMQEPVLDVVLARMPATLLLAASVLSFALVTGVALGILAARNLGRWQDSAVTALSLLGYATPNFWLGLMIVLLFAVWLPVLPPYGMTSIGMGLTGLQHAADVAWHLVLPTFALGTHYMGVFARITRAAMIDVADMEFVKAARAKGIGELQLLWRHVFRNAMLAVVTYTGVQAGSLISGTVLIETVFAWPGVGRLAFDSIASRDHPVLLGTFLVTSVLVILINLATDIVYTFVDPRIEVKG
ncbi:MAG: ABC transporter permease [Rhodobacteraceae bacterium]|jgi:peptide/nickel transport system permease protein|nr:ABC transporter permease [Paracoccaceae bacterium]